MHVVLLEPMKRSEKAIRAYKASATEKGRSSEKGSSRISQNAEKKVHGLVEESKAGAKRAAKLLMLLDSEDASRIVKHLNEDEIETITREIADIGKIDSGEANKILDDFHLKIKRGRPVKGGPAMAKEILVASLGEDRGMSLFRRAVPIEIDNPFDFLDDLDFQQILMLLKREPPPVIATIIPYVAPGKASEVLEALPPETQMKVVRRVARMERIAPEALMKVAEALREKIRKQGRLVTEEIDGPQVLAEILNNMSAENELSILNYLDGYNPELVEHIRDRLYTIEVIFNVEDQDLQALLREFSEEEIAIILKGKDERTRSRILDNISERMRRLVAEESDRLGAMKRSDVDRTTRDFVTYIRELAEEGRIVLIRNEQLRDE